MSNKRESPMRDARIRAGLSQAELGDKLGVSQMTISNWETGRTSPPAEQKGVLNTILGLNQIDSESAQASPVAAWLSKTRLKLGWSVPELAEKSGVTAPAIYRIEAGITRNVRQSTLSKIEKALGAELPSDAAKELSEEAQVSGLGALEDFDPHSDEERPREPGIYVLYDVSERPIYVGEGADVRKRIRDHEEKFWFKRPIVESASWIKISETRLREQIETLLIKFLKSNAVINKQNVDR
jgi:transcriptional regulator with XRE-family HTH domain